MSKDKLNVAIIYYSMTGNNSQMARWSEEAAKEAGVEVRVRKVAEDGTPNNPAWEAEAERSKDVVEATSDDLAWADLIVFHFPTRFGAPAGKMKAFIDSQGGLWAEGKLTDKVVTATTSAENMHGGQEMALMMFYTSMAHWGAIPVFPGYTDEVLFAAGGNPYGTSVTVSHDEPLSDAIEAAVKHQVKRAIGIAKKLSD